MSYKFNPFTGNFDTVDGIGANNTLSNLVSPTAVNQDLLLDTGKTVRLPNGTALTSRDSFDTTDINLIRLSGSDLILIGDNTPGKNIEIYRDSSSFISLNASYIGIYANSAASTIDLAATTINLYTADTATTFRFYDDDGSNYAGLKAAGTTTTNYTITLPATSPALNQILISDASGNLSWGNQINLNTSPVEFLEHNQVRLSQVEPSAWWGGPLDALVFDSEALYTLGNINQSGFVVTSDRSTGSAADLYVRGGEATGLSGDGGSILVNGGNSANGVGGGVQILSGNGATAPNLEITSGAVNGNAGNSGTVLIQTQNATPGDSGNITLLTGTASGTRGVINLNAPNIVIENTLTATSDFTLNSATESGSFFFTTLNTTNPAATSGLIRTRTGDTSGTGASSGEIELITGDTTGIASSSGTVFIRTGDTANAGGSPVSGGITLYTGNVGAGTGDSGGINLTTGTSAGGTRGTITMNASALNLANAPVNSNIFPTTDVIYQFGDFDKRFSVIAAWVATDYFELVTPAEDYYGDIRPNQMGADMAITAYGSGVTANTYDLGIRSYRDAFFDTLALSSGTTGALEFKTGNNSGGNSGAITLQTGTASGTRGDINLNAPAVNFTQNLQSSGGSTNKSVYLDNETGVYSYTSIQMDTATALYDGTFPASRLFGFPGVHIEGQSGPVAIRTTGNMTDGDSTTATPAITMQTRNAVAVVGTTTGAISLTTGNAVTTSGNITLQTGTGGSASSGLVRLQSGNSSNSSTGIIDIFSGNAGSSGNSGDVYLYSGEGGSTSGRAGLVGLYVGTSYGSNNGNVIELIAGPAAGTGAGGNINITSGFAASNYNSGAIFIQSDGATGSGNSGNITVRSGTTVDGLTGTVSVGSGNADGIAGSGAVTFSSGDNSEVGPTGNVTVKSGNITSGFAAATTGSVTVASGNGVGSINSGNVSISTGTVISGTRGDITLSANKLNVTSITEGQGLPVWKKYTVTHTALQAAALTNSITLFSLPAYGVIHNVVISHSTAFAGTGITGYTVEVGIAGNTNKYASAFNVYQATGAGVGQTSSVADFESKSGSTTIQITATSTGANLNQSTAGSVDVWVLWGTMQ